VVGLFSAADQQMRHASEGAGRAYAGT
jgi:hypothetical protein